MEYAIINKFSTWRKQIKKKSLHKSWKSVKGDTTLRLDYPLNDRSIVFDVGGYKGDFAAAIHEKYGSTVYVFEPHPIFYAELCERFSGNESIIPCKYGLSGSDGSFTLSDDADASSFLQSNSGHICDVKSFQSAIDELSVEKVDLMKVNIEGEEYDLLSSMIKNQQHKIVEHLQVQFHDFFPDSAARRQFLTSALGKTHIRKWCYEFIWESWSKKPS